MGILVAWLNLKLTGSENMRLFIGVGLLGGFTTFSTFSFDAYFLLARKTFNLFGLYVVGSVSLSIFALILGLGIGQKLLSHG